MVFDVSKAKKFLDAGGAGGPANSAAFGTVPRLASLVGPTAASKGAVPSAFSKLIEIQGRADELSKRIEGVLGKPAVRTFLGVPSERMLQLQEDRLASQQRAISGVVGSRFSAVASVAARGGDLPWTGKVGGGVLLGDPQGSARKWSALGSFGDRYKSVLPRSALASALADSPAAKMGMGPFLVGARGETLNSAVSGLARMYEPPHAALNFSGLSGLGQAGKLLQNYLGFAQRADRAVSGWTKTFEGVFERLRRATEFYPRDPDGQPVPPWNARLYLLARAAYRADGYEAQARFLNEIGADGSVDNVLFVRELLAPTFDPVRPDRRVDWWLMEPDEAKAWLCKRLEDRGFETWQDEYRRRGRQISYAETGDPEGLDGILREHLRGRAPRAVSAEEQFFEDQRAILLLEELAQVLSERQLQVAALFLEEQAHERQTYEEIGRELGMAPGTVKSHVFRARNNPGVSEILRPDATQPREKPHRR